MAETTTDFLKAKNDFEEYSQLNLLAPGKIVRVLRRVDYISISHWGMFAV